MTLLSSNITFILLFIDYNRNRKKEELGIVKRESELDRSFELWNQCLEK